MDEIIHLISTNGPNRKCHRCGVQVTDENSYWDMRWTLYPELATCEIRIPEPKVNWSSERAQVQIVIDGAEKAAMGDSNDREIQCLQDALEESVDLLDRALARIAELEAS